MCGCHQRKVLSGVAKKTLERLSKWDLESADFWSNNDPPKSAVTCSWCPQLDISMADRQKVVSAKKAILQKLDFLQ